MSTDTFVYVTYIAAPQEKVWQAVVDPEKMRQYWSDPLGDGPAHMNISDWKPGSRWEHQRNDESRTVDIVGKVVESVPPHRLVFTWARPKDADDESHHSRVSFDIKPHGNELICLTVTHEQLDGDPLMHKGVSDGWPKVLSNLKSFLETGQVLPRSTVVSQSTTSASTAS